MRKAIIVAAATAIAIAPFTVLTASVAHADVCDDEAAKLPGYGGSPGYLQCKAILAQQKQHTPAAPPRQTQAPPTRVPVQTPQAPPKPAPPTYAPPSTIQVQTPQVVPPKPPAAVPVVTPKINPPAAGAPRNASRVTGPKGVDASSQAVAAAKAAPATRIDPANPTKAPTQVDFNQQVQNVVSNHGGNVDVVKAGDQSLVRPRHWDYLDYDMYHRPRLYNPLNEAMAFRYFYNGAYRELYVPAGGRMVLDVATAGLFPFTAVSDSYVASGSFTGGAWTPPDGWTGPPPPDYTPPPDPTVYQDVSADVPADNQTVQVGQVEVMGHDDSLPAGSRDAFLLDDSTLAWGQVNAPGSGSQITVTKTQSIPGLGPMDNGSYLVALAAHEQPTDNTWWLWPLGGGVLVIAAGLVARWFIRRKRNADLTASP
jgi:hypothetical protein